MKLVVAVALVLLVSSIAVAAPKAIYTLYYLDSTHNVCKISLDSAGHPAGSAARITTRGGYDCFSVSPDEKYVVGHRETGRYHERDIDMDWIRFAGFVDTLGAKQSRRPLDAISERFDTPAICWFPKGAYFMALVGNFDVDIDVYRASDCKRLVKGVSTEPAVSTDGKFVFCQRDSSKSALLEAATGKVTWLDGDYDSAVWVGDTHKLAWVSLDGVRVGEVIAGSRGPAIPGARVLLAEWCNQLRWLPSKGLYLEAGSPGDPTGYYSSDLKTVPKGAVLPPEKRAEDASEWAKTCRGASWSNARFSPDRRFVVCPVYNTGTNKMPEIRVFDRPGHSFVVAHGKAPQWRGNDISAFER